MTKQLRPLRRPTPAGPHAGAARFGHVPSLFSAAMLVVFALTSFGCAGTSASDAGNRIASDGGGPADSTRAPDDIIFSGEAWADNWFALYLENNLIVEDSVPITTERSFNAEAFSFTASYPFVLAFVLKDYKANDSGLEYIGQPNQQMGDGGFIVQVRNDVSGDIVAVSNANFRCLVIHKAPLNPECEGDPNPEETCMFSSQDEPAGWKDADFDDSAWPNATEHSVNAVSPKEGYDEITWTSEAKLVWGSDLNQDNTILCRARISAP